MRHDLLESHRAQTPAPGHSQEFRERPGATHS